MRPDPLNLAIILAALAGLADILGGLGPWWP